MFLMPATNVRLQSQEAAREKYFPSVRVTPNDVCVKGMTY